MWLKNPPGSRAQARDCGKQFSQRKRTKSFWRTSACEPIWQVSSMAWLRRLCLLLGGKSLGATCPPGFTKKCKKWRQIACSMTWWPSCSSLLSFVWIVMRGKRDIWPSEFNTWTTSGKCTVLSGTCGSWQRRSTTTFVMLFFTLSAARGGSPENNLARSGLLQVPMVNSQWCLLCKLIRLVTLKQGRPP